MIGYDETNPENQLSSTQYSIAGAFSGFVTRCLLQPLDVLKIRFQLQVEPIDLTLGKSKYTSLYQAFRCILKEEGFGAFWKGHVPAQGLSVVYGIVQFSSFELYTSFAVKESVGIEHKALVHALCGGLAGCTSTLCAHPFDLLRTRLVSQGVPKIYKGVFAAISSIYLREGWLAFYKGLLPTLVQIVPYAGAQFGFYRLFQDTFGMILKNSDGIGFYTNVVSGMGAGVAAKTLTYPLDLVKKRLQIQGFEEARRSFGAVRTYSGMFQCLGRVLVEERLRGLFKGLSPSLLKAGLATSCHFTVYEQTCNLMKMQCKKN